MDASNSPRSRGRPRVPDKARKRNNVTIRMRDELKSKVEQNAAAHQRSISEEIETRLVSSFAEEVGFGGPEMRQMAYLMASSFAVAAGPNARITDPIAYSNGAAGVLRALLVRFPDGEDRALAVEALASRLLSLLAQEKLSRREREKEQAE
jgi:hypothetical protein